MSREMTRVSACLDICSWEEHDACKTTTRSILMKLEGVERRRSEHYRIFITVTWDVAIAVYSDEDYVTALLHRYTVYLAFRIILCDHQGQDWD